MRSLVLALVIVLSAYGIGLCDEEHSDQEDNGHEQCLIGPQGEQGVQGDIGASGENGSDGIDGKDGVNGQDAEHNDFDYGAYLNLIVFETKNSEWGVLATWLNESDETRVYVGGKVYLDRIINQKKDE